MGTWPTVGRQDQASKSIIRKSAPTVVKLIDDHLSARIAGDEKLRSEAENAYHIVLEGEASLGELIAKMLDLASSIMGDEMLLGVLLRDEDEFIVALDPRAGRVGVARITPHGKEHGHEVYKLYSKAPGYAYVTVARLD